MTRAVQLGDGGWLSIAVFVRYPQATDEAPIGGSMQISIPADTDGMPKLLRRPGIRSLD